MLTDRCTDPENYLRFVEAAMYLSNTYLSSYALAKTLFSTSPISQLSPFIECYFLDGN